MSVAPGSPGYGSVTRFSMSRMSCVEHDSGCRLYQTSTVSDVVNASSCVGSVKILRFLLFIIGGGWITKFLLHESFIVIVKLIEK